MTYFLRLCVVVWLASAGSLAAQATPTDTLLTTTPQSVRAALRFGDVSAPFVMAEDGSGRRSIPLAAAASAVVPGLGQAYNRDWIKATVGIAIEAALVYGYVTNRQRGLDGEEAYVDFAHRHWSPVKYARWLEDYTDWLGSVERQTIAVPTGIDFQNPDAWTLEQVQQVRTFFNDLRRVEDLAYHPNPPGNPNASGASFSHHIPYFSEQQYYELIGKYYQFAPGWSDYPDWTTADGYDAARINPDVEVPRVRQAGESTQFVVYARDHAHANDLLRRASRISSIIVLNHIAAAIEAAVSAKLHNDRLDASISILPDADGALQSRATLAWRW